MSVDAITRLVLPRTSMLWYLHDVAERVFEVQCAMAAASKAGDVQAHATHRAEQDRLLAEVRMWQAEVVSDRRHAYLLGIETVERDAFGRWARIGDLQLLGTPEPRFGVQVRGPFSRWVGAGEAARYEPAARPDPCARLYVPVTRKVSLKNETAGQARVAL
jgi:hypothetical protein